MIAVTHPGKLGDALYALPAARALAARYGCQVDFWTSPACRALGPLVSSQRFIKGFHVAEGYIAERHDFGTQPWSVPVEGDYRAVYHLGFRGVPDCPLPDYCCRLAGLSPQPVLYDLPERGERFGGNVPPTDWNTCYVVLAARGETTYRQCFREFVAASPLLVFEIGAPGESVATDLGSHDCTGMDFLDMARLIADARVFVGLMSAPLVVANGFDCVRVAPHDGASWDMRHAVQSCRNHYPVGDDHEEILRRVRWLPTLSKTIHPDDYWSLCWETAHVDDAMSRLRGLYDPSLHTHRRWEYGVALQALWHNHLLYDPNACILDIGGGPSVLPGCLRGMGKKVMVCDPGPYESWQMAAGVEYVRAPFEQLAPGRYDAVLCLSTLEHVKDDGAFFRLLLDRVAPGGILVLTVDYHPSGQPLHPGHLRTYNAAALGRLADRADGFDMYKGKPAWTDGAGMVYGYDFASLVLQRKSNGPQ